MDWPAIGLKFVIGDLLCKSLHAEGVHGMWIKGVQHVLQNSHLDFAAIRLQELQDVQKS